VLLLIILSNCAVMRPAPSNHSIRQVIAKLITILEGGAKNPSGMERKFAATRDQLTKAYGELVETPHYNYRNTSNFQICRLAGCEMHTVVYIIASSLTVLLTELVGARHMSVRIPYQ